MSDTKAKKRSNPKNNKGTNTRSKKSENQTQETEGSKPKMDPKTLSCFIKRMKELRHELNMPQAVLAQKLFVTTGCVGNYETGIRIPDLEMIQNIASVFGVSVDYLLGRTNAKTFYVDPPSDGSFMEGGSVYNPHKGQGVIDETYTEIYHRLIELGILSQDDAPTDPVTKAKVKHFIDNSFIIIKTADKILKG